MGHELDLYDVNHNLYAYCVQCERALASNHGKPGRNEERLKRILEGLEALVKDERTLAIVRKHSDNEEMQTNISYLSLKLREIGTDQANKLAVKVDNLPVIGWVKGEVQKKDKAALETGEKSTKGGVVLGIKEKSTDEVKTSSESNSEDDLDEDWGRRDTVVIRPVNIRSSEKKGIISQETPPLRNAETEKRKPPPIPERKGPIPTKSKETSPLPAADVKENKPLPVSEKKGAIPAESKNTSPLPAADAKKGKPPPIPERKGTIPPPKV